MSGLLADEQPVLVAVSGGVDSMVLLRVLAELAPQHRWKLAAAHFNHQLRGAASNADAELVRKTAQELQIPIFTDRGDVKAEATTSKVSIEMAARQLRYGFLSRTAREQGIGAVAVAHHAGDQAELFFLRLFRGAGTIGLGGMKPVAPLPCGPEIRLIRPFLNEPKETLRQFATEHQIPFAEDATNASLDIQRNPHPQRTHSPPRTTLPTRSEPNDPPSHGHCSSGRRIRHCRRRKTGFNIMGQSYLTSCPLRFNDAAFNSNSKPWAKNPASTPSNGFASTPVKP